MLALNKSSFVTVSVSQGGGAQWETLFAYGNDAQRVRSFQDYGTVAVPFSLDGGEQTQLALRFRAGNTLLPLAIHTEASQREAGRFRLLTLGGALLGVLTFIAIATLPLIFFDGRSFLLYAGAQLTAFALCAHLDGFTTAHLWPASPEISRGASGQLLGGVARPGL